MPFYNFKCKSCEAFYKDQLVKMGTTEIECKCGEKAEKALSYNFSSIGLPNGHITHRSKSRK